MRVIVTGATGFVGGRIVRRYVQRGDDVTAIVRRTSPALEELGITQLDGGFDAIVPEVLDGADVIVHAAATDGPDLATARRLNRDGTARLVDAARAAGVPRLVHISTTAVYDRPTTETAIAETSRRVTDPPSTPDQDPPASDYAVTKAEAEDEVARAIDDGLCAAVLRPPAVLGAGPTSTWGTRVPRLVFAGRTPPMHRETTFGWVHVEDLVDAVVAASESADVFTANVVGGNLPFGTYLDAILTAAPAALPRRAEPSTAGPIWRGYYTADRAPSILGVPIKRRFDDAMAEITDSWRAGDPGGTE